MTKQLGLIGIGPDQCPRCDRHVSGDEDREHGTMCIYCRQDLLGLDFTAPRVAVRSGWKERGDEIVTRWLKEVAA